MDPPPSLSPHPPTMHLNYPDSADSSPRSHLPDTFHDPLPPLPGSKLRLMCSYGGHIIPRPHDKSLCYVGGETRMVVVDRHSSFSSVVSRLSRTLLDGRPFTLKYQLPNEDLDSLVSVTTDEDLDNMIEEYDRINSSSSSSGIAPSRIRLFLFFGKPETVASMGSLLDDAKSETWFVDALNGSLLPRNLSDSAATECLVNLDSFNQDSEAQLEEGVEMNKPEMMIKNGGMLQQEILQTGGLPDSPMLENGSSSFGSSSSSPSMSNLPPILVRVDHDQRVGNLEEQFAKMAFAQVAQKQDDGCYNGGGVMPGALPPLPTAIVPVGMAAAAPQLNPSGNSSENLNRISSEDERSDQGVPVISRKKPPLPLQTAQLKPAAGASHYNLPSPDSVASDSSVASAGNPVCKPMYYHEQSSPDAKTEISIQNPQIQAQQPQTQNPGYAQYDQQPQQYIHTNKHYIPHPAAATPLPMSSYYPIYATQPQQTPNNNQPIDQHQQYPVYVMPVAQTQQYMSVQQPNPSHPPLYPTTTLSKPEASAAAVGSVYRTAVATNTSLVPIQGNQFQQQYVSYAPMQLPPQSIGATSVGGNYGFECAKGATEQVYYTQVQAAPGLPPQYQTMNAGTAVALADASTTIHHI